MFNANYVIIFFRILNFLIIIILFKYIFKKYFFKTLKLNLFKYKEHFHNLKKKLDELTLKSKDLDIKITQQERLTNSLNNKIEIWKKIIDQEKDEKVKSDIIIKEKIDQKIKLQEELLTVNVIKANLLPEIISEAKKKLEIEFENKNNIINFQNNLIEFIKKG